MAGRFRKGGQDPMTMAWERNRREYQSRHAGGQSLKSVSRAGIPDGGGVGADFPPLFLHFISSVIQTGVF
ncbi:hypothetical protein J2X56_001186 [Herbaspirillum sp. 1173]|uniref:hypothetical protein n=1 Tax=Herbaspirillum sp. 1173 TaxID=2817734 RepID=UPI002862E288|nr:hypothetical protein [Herbaspirillum sp. 1173]MDR6739200.1 hypothetical protein [Herbaspirillum sp. 1173]